MNRKSLIGFAVGLAAFGYFSLVRDYPFQLALLMGAALMVLVLAGVRTWDGLRALADRDDE